MEYPNQNLQTLLKKDAQRAQLEVELFGDTLALEPPKRLVTSNLLQRYSATVLSMFNKR